MDNYNKKNEILKSLEFEDAIETEIKNGIELFIKELFSKFKESDFQFEE